MRKFDNLSVDFFRYDQHCCLTNLEFKAAVKFNITCVKSRKSKYIYFNNHIMVLDLKFALFAIRVRISGDLNDFLGPSRFIESDYKKNIGN